MKTIHLILCISASLLICASCGSMDDVYKDLIKDSQEVLLSKLDSVEAFSGSGRVKFFIPPQSDSRISGAHFSWDNDAQSKDVPLDITTENEIILDDISEGSHIIYVSATNDKGSKSLATSFTVSSYGEAFLSTLSKAEILSVARNSEGICYFQFHHSSSPSYKYLELTYTSTDGQKKTLQVDKSTRGLFIDDLSGDNYSYHSVYSLAGQAFEDIFSEEIEAHEILPPQITVDKSASLAFARGYTVEIPCLCSWETSCVVEEAAKSWLSASLEGKIITIKALARNGEPTPRTGTVILTSDNKSETITVTQEGTSPKLGTAYGTEGIVFWQNPEKPNEYKIISKTCVRMAWSTAYSMTRATSYTGKTIINGVEYNNCDLIRNMPDYGSGNTYALEWIEELGEGWYMPSVTELRDELWPCFNGTVYEASTKGPFTSATVDEKECRNRFESAVLAIGGMKVNQGSDTGTGTSIMSCTEKDSKTMLGFRVSNSLVWEADKTAVTFFARGVKVVTIDE